MRNKKIIFALFALLIIAVPVYMAIASESVLTEGNFHKFRLQGRDPFDPFKGKYLRLNYPNLEVPSNDSFKRGEDIYVTIGKDAEGYSFFEAGHKKAPKKGDYLKTKVIDSYKSNRSPRMVIELVEGVEVENEELPAKHTVLIKIPDHMTKYFINEDYAMKGETIMLRERNKIFVGIRIKDGECRIQDIYVRGKPLMEFLEN